MDLTTELINLAQIDLATDAREHDPVELELLAEDMARNGQLQEIILESKEGRYEVISGVGRLRAARKLGWEKIRAQVHTGLSDFDKAAITFSENEHREDVDPIYQAYQLAKMRKARDCSGRELGKAVGLPDNRISEYLTLAKLDPRVAKSFQRWKLSRGQALEIARLETPENQLKMAERCKKEDLSVRALHYLVNKELKPSRDNPVAVRPPADTDPLANSWPKIHTQTKGWAWIASHSEKLTWVFEVNLEPMYPENPEKTLGEWFLAMAAAFGATKLDAATVEQLVNLQHSEDFYTNLVESAIKEGQEADKAAKAAKDSKN